MTEAEPKRWMRLPLRHKRDDIHLHRENDWCAKAGCRPATPLEIDLAVEKIETIQHSPAPDAGAKDTRTLIIGNKPISGLSWREEWGIPESPAPDAGVKENPCPRCGMFKNPKPPYTFRCTCDEPRKPKAPAPAEGAEQFRAQAKELASLCEKLRPGTGAAIETFVNMAYEEGAEPRYDLLTDWRDLADKNLETAQRALKVIEERDETIASLREQLSKQPDWELKARISELTDSNVKLREQLAQAQRERDEWKHATSRCM